MCVSLSEERRIWVDLVDPAAPRAAFRDRTLDGRPWNGFAAKYAPIFSYCGRGYGHAVLLAHRVALGMISGAVPVQVPRNT